eukprot:jgi/Orpsp1_1/1185264/evm.model.c7180000092983.1
MNILLLEIFILIFYLKISITTKLNYTKINNKRDESNIWIPEVGTSWNWILNPDNGIESDNKVDVLDIDLFDNDASTIAALKEDGHHIICYFSVGTYEDWRPDAEEYLKVEDLVKEPMENWEDEYYVDITNPLLKPIISARFDLAKEKGCDAVECDNMDIYTVDSIKKWKVPITISDQISFDLWLSNEAHSRGLSIAMKNDVENLVALVNYFDFAINEECYDYNECKNYKDTFIKNNKAVFAAAYGDHCDKDFIKKLTEQTYGLGLSVIIKEEDMKLGNKYIQFDAKTFNYDSL